MLKVVALIARLFKRIVQRTHHLAGRDINGILVFKRALFFANNKAEIADAIRQFR